MFQFSTGLAASKRLRTFLGSTVLLAGTCASAFGQTPPAQVAIPTLGSSASPDVTRFQPPQSLPDMTFPPLTAVQAEEKGAPAPAPAADPKALPSPAGKSSIRSIQGISLLFTYRMPSGSAAEPPHSAPPSKPGNTSEPTRLGGL